jgi:hypothetical protein
METSSLLAKSDKPTGKKKEESDFTAGDLVPFGVLAIAIAAIFVWIIIDIVRSAKELNKAREEALRKASIGSSL